MSQVENGTGYKFLILCKNGLHNRRYVHRLVASAFIPNPHDFRYVNHKDENKSNNKVSNLEWCNMAYNNAYGSRTSRYISTRSKAVLQYDLAGNLIGEYSSATEASQATGIYRRSICSCCNGRYLSAGGYKWKYKNQ